MAAAVPPDYRALTADALPAYLAGVAVLRERLGGAPADWTVREVSDGYMNIVYLVDGPQGSLCFKQSLPHVRVDASWPLSLERNGCEKLYFETVRPHVGRSIPEIYHHDPAQFILVMEKLSPHVALRTALIAGRRLPAAITAVARFMARATFHTSDLHLPYERKHDLIAGLKDNDIVHRTMRELVFRDPYSGDRTRWTTPQLDDISAALRNDPEIRIAAARLGYLFMTATQALVHSDLHTGAVMVTDDDTRIIDPEFTVYGPIAIDPGVFIAHLLMAYYSQPGHRTSDDDRREFQRWILQEIAVFWNEFRAAFLTLWRADAAGGDAFQARIFADAAGAAALDAERERFLDTIYNDAIGFAAVIIIRCILGYAHFGDLETIADPDARAACEAGALRLARELLLRPGDFRAITNVTEAAPGCAVDRQAPGTRLTLGDAADHR